MSGGFSDLESVHFSKLDSGGVPDNISGINPPGASLGNATPDGKAGVSSLVVYGNIFVSISNSVSIGTIPFFSEASTNVPSCCAPGQAYTNYSRNLYYAS